MRELHEHHQKRREALRQEHGDIYEQFAAVHRELEALSSELNAMSEHGTALEATFSRFVRDFVEET